MRRRDFVKVLGGAAATLPLAARAQQTAMPVIGYLCAQSLENRADLLKPLRQGLNEAGYFEGQNLAIEYRSADDHAERLPTLAIQLVDRHVAVIVASGGNVVALAAKAATATIPIVFTLGGDPVQLGLVASMNRPGGNITGVTILAGLLGAKRLELLRQLVPKATTIGILTNPTNPANEIYIKDAQDSARTLGVEPYVLNASTATEIDTAFATVSEQKLAALLVITDTLFIGRREQIVAQAASLAIPAIYEYRDFVARGGLMSYGPSYTEINRQAGIYVGRILKGANPADLPVMQPTKFELVLNLKTAKALGLTVPQSLLVAADEVIE
jgi:putative tryptophan/tyrosine transport system substrate-binding protein